ncbi:SDR family oxidoreductase [Teichococcus vastitatis]|uniref:SDR family oxidoreductase n=1 Tax=Teichococcus vastitatis TaxID=2307076 RepID=A0ABS9W8A6_9PROT|nr:SDR family oxidoreductase [Pseudoroseomonas vastitatis]MCI0755519.1 SDR family oxidoreductase [Pseudoroseomonas vastitatis]
MKEISMSSASRRSILTLAAAGPAAAMAGSAKAVPASSAGSLQSRPGEGRAAVITGSSRGIGAATARRLGAEGYAVTVNYLTNRDLAEQVVRDIESSGGRAIARQGDVADPAAVAALFDANDRAFGGVDVVVNNAGRMNVGLFAQMTDAAFDRMMATNVKGSFNVLREAARRTREGGRIISLSSSITLQRPAGGGAYAASKAAQDFYTSALAKELAGRQISVNAVAPGAVDTQLLRQHGDAALAGIPAMTPHGRIGLPEDIANVIAALCSNDGQWIHGQVVFANGGIG